MDGGVGQLGRFVSCSAKITEVPNIPIVGEKGVPGVNSAGQAILQAAENFNGLYSPLKNCIDVLGLCSLFRLH